MTFFSSRVIGRGAAAVRAVVAAVAIAFPSIVISPVVRVFRPSRALPLEPRHRGHGERPRIPWKVRLAPLLASTIPHSYLRLPSKDERGGVKTFFDQYLVRTELSCRQDFTAALLTAKSEMAAAFETLRLLIAPGMSSLPMASQHSRVLWRRPLPSDPRTRTSGILS